MFVVSSPDMGQTWTKELTLHADRDMREPFFVAVDGKLFFYYFEAGTNPIDFEVSRMLRTQYLGHDEWSPIEPWGQAGEACWQFNVRNNTIYTISYVGSHYDVGHLGQVSLFLNSSSDGVEWKSVGAGPFYTGKHIMCWTVFL